jgi:CDP-glucose 4,6-dehydratase
VRFPNSQFWSGRRVLVTGHTGFKGSWLALWLKRLGANLTGIALAPNSRPSLFELAGVADGMQSHICDVRNLRELQARVRETSPEIVFHLAAQSLVRQGYSEPVETYSTNVMGTVNLLESVRPVPSTKVVVVVSTDKVYRDSGSRGAVCTEDRPLGGHDPYSASKAACEIVTQGYREAFFARNGTAVATARAGNVIGGGDWSADRLIPDAIRAWGAGRCLSLRMPHAVRPWQHVLEPLAGYLILAERVFLEPDKAGAYNFGPATGETATVADVIRMAAASFGGGAVEITNDPNAPLESEWLALDATKARSELGVEARWALDAAISKTMDWYRQHSGGTNAAALCQADLDAYESNS